MSKNFTVLCNRKLFIRILEQRTIVCPCLISNIKFSIYMFTFLSLDFASILKYQSELVCFQIT